MAGTAHEITLITSTQYNTYDHDKATSDCIAMAAIRAPPYETQFRSPVDIVTVIDHSGSMAGDKLELVKKTLLFVIDQLKACDQLCLVLYDDVVTVEFPLTPMTWENKEMTKAKVEKITHRGATNLCGGLLKGMEQIILRSGDQKAKVASVLLFTDGLANRGIADCDRIIAAMGTVGSLRMEELLTDTSLLEYFPPRRQSIEQAPPTYKLQQQAPPVPRKWSSEHRKRHQFQDTAPQQSTISPPKSDDTPRRTGAFDGTIYTFWVWLRSRW